MNLVRHFMATEVETATQDTPIQEVAQMMAKADVGAIPIVRGASLEGIVTDRDIVVRVVAEGQASSAKAIDAMSVDVVTVTPDQNVSDARELMAAGQIRRLPVVKGDELVGMISLGDIAVQEPSERATGEVLQEISRSADTEITNEGKGPVKGTPDRVREAG
ncbi:MAG: CBS domain-containing protein [Actinomycetota bacterium]